MTLYAQHGHGKSDKIDVALKDGDIEGAILSPRNEKPEKLAACVEKLRSDFACDVLVDPQYYVSTFAPAKYGHLLEYQCFEGGLAAGDFSLRKIRSIAKKSLDYQASLGVTSLISPTVLFESLSDRWSQIAINLADASLEYHGTMTKPPPLLLSFVFGEEALSADDEINRFLDTVTQDDWEMSGFYFIAARHDSVYSQDFTASRLASFLYLVHVLGSVNGLEVIVGYSDFVGLLLRAAGASTFATGWSQGLRQFARKSFLQRPPGGQPPRDRYSSTPLLSSIFMQELQEIFEVGMMEEVLSDVELDKVIRAAKNPSSASWNLARSQSHHWQSLHSLDSAITGRPRSDALSMLRKVRDALGLYTSLERAGIEFEQVTGKHHLLNWSRALTDFAGRAGFRSS